MSKPHTDEFNVRFCTDHKTKIIPVRGHGKRDLGNLISEL